MPVAQHQVTHPCRCYGTRFFLTLQGCRQYHPALCIILCHQAVCYLVGVRVIKSFGTRALQGVYGYQRSLMQLFQLLYRSNLNPHMQNISCKVTNTTLFTANKRPLITNEKHIHHREKQKLYDFTVSIPLQ